MYALQHILNIRHLWIYHFPFIRSLISTDILLTVLNAKVNGEKLYVKCLFANVSGSIMGTRYHFEKLVEDGWIELENDLKDKRLKICKPSHKLENRFRTLAKDLHKNTL